MQTDRTLIQSNARNFEPRITRRRKKISHAATEIEQSSQSLPSIPPWAKGLDMDGIVQLDALIDENGNVAEASQCLDRAYCNVRPKERWRYGYFNQHCRTGSRLQHT